MPLRGQPKRFSFHIETNVKATQVKLRTTISHRLNAISESCVSRRLFVGRRLNCAVCLAVWLRFGGILVLRSLAINCPWQLLNDLATWRRFLIRDDQTAIGSLVDVIFFSVALRGHSEDKEKSKPDSELQSCTSIPGP